MITFDTWFRKNRVKHLYASNERLVELYEQETSWIFGLKSAVDIKVFAYLLKLADKEGKVKFTPTLRKGLARLLGISMQQITNSLKALRDKKLIEGSRTKYDILL